MRTPKFLYFDLGNVLISFCHDRMARQMAEVVGWPVERMQRLLAEESEPRTSLQWRLERGDISDEAFHRELAVGIGQPYDPQQMELAFCDIFGRIDASLELVTRLAAAGQRLGILSNTNSPQWRFLIDGRFPELNTAFDAYVTSFGARSLKPDPGIYRYAAEQAGVAPEEVFFADDRVDNVQGALAFGFDAVVFTTTERLERDLRERGVSW